MSPRILIYRRDQPGAELTILLTSFSGGAYATITEGSKGVAKERTVSIPSDKFAGLFAAFSEGSSLASAKLTDKSPAIESETHHIITRMDRGSGEQDMYAIPLDGASVVFATWFKELTESTAKK